LRREDQRRDNNVEQPDAEIAETATQRREFQAPPWEAELLQRDRQQATEGDGEGHGIGAVERPLPFQMLEETGEFADQTPDRLDDQSAIVGIGPAIPGERRDRREIHRSEYSLFQHRLDPCAPIL